MKKEDFTNTNDYERDQRVKRRNFIERMEQKLRFKESVYRTSHRTGKYLLN